MDLFHFVGMRQAKNIGEILEVLMMPGKSLAPHSALVQPERLHLSSHGPIEQENPLGEQRFELIGLIRHSGRHGVGFAGYVSIIDEIGCKTSVPQL